MASLSDPRIQHAIKDLSDRDWWLRPATHRWFAGRTGGYVYTTRGSSSFEKIKFAQEEVDLIIAHLKVQGLWLA